MPLRPRRRTRAVGVRATLAVAVGATALGTLPVLTGGAVATPSRAVAAAGTVAELRLSRSQAITGERVELRATVSPSRARAVVLQRRAGDRWVEVTRGRTDASGAEVFTMAAPRASTTYRVRAPRVVIGGTTYAADVSPARTLEVQPQQVFLRMPEATTAGSMVWAFVECFPHRPGRSVVVRQRSEGGAWQTVASGVQGDRGMLTLDVSVPGEGVYEHRAVVAAANGAPEARSLVRRITVTAAP